MKKSQGLIGGVVIFGFLLVMGLFMVSSIEIGDSSDECNDGEFPVVINGEWYCSGSSVCLNGGNCTFDNIEVTGTITNTTTINMNVSGDIITDGDIYGLFNWFIAPNSTDHLGFNRSHLYIDKNRINKTIADHLVTIYYNISVYDLPYGTEEDYINRTEHPKGDYDGLSFNITEQAGTPALDFRFNFTDITKFSRGIMRYRTSSLAGNRPIIQVWDYEGSHWEDYNEVAETLTFKTIEQSIFDDDEHIGEGEDEGVVQVRLYKSGTGNINNRYYFDWIAISSGIGVPSPEEVDPIYTSEKTAINNTLKEYISSLYIKNDTVGGYNLRADEINLFEGTNYPYKIYADNNLFVINNQYDGTTRTDLRNFKGDGSKNVVQRIYGVGNATDITNSEALVLRWRADSNRYEIYTTSTGTGEQRPIWFSSDYTGEAGQLRLEPNKPFKVFTEGLYTLSDELSLDVEFDGSCGVEWECGTAWTISNGEAYSPGALDNHLNFTDDLLPMENVSYLIEIDYSTGLFGLQIGFGGATKLLTTGFIGNHKKDKIILTAQDNTTEFFIKNAGVTSAVNITRLSIKRYYGDVNLGNVFISNLNGTGDLDWEGTAYFGGIQVNGTTENVGFTPVDMLFYSSFGYKGTTPVDPSTEGYNNFNGAGRGGDGSNPFPPPKDGGDYIIDVAPKGTQSGPTGANDGSIYIRNTDGYQKNISAGAGTEIIEINDDGFKIRNNNKLWFIDDGEENIFFQRVGDNLIANISLGALIIANSTGGGTIGYGSAYTFTSVNNDTNELEEFNLGNTLFNQDGSINHTAFGECYRQLPIENSSDCQEEVYKSEYCYYFYGKKFGCFKETIDTYYNMEDFSEWLDGMTYEIVNYSREVCGVMYKDAVDVNCEQAKIRQTLALLNKNIDLTENITVFHTSTLADHYITNTTKDPATLTKIENFYNTLQDKTYQEMKDLVLTQEGKLSDSVLFDYELSDYGSYNLEAIGHTNRAMNVLMLWKIAQIEDKQQQQLDCWDLSTQQEITNCMRSIQ